MFSQRFSGNDDSSGIDVTQLHFDEGLTLSQTHGAETCALVKQASDRRIIDPAGTSHVQKKANVFRQIHDSKMSPQMSNLMSDGSTKPQIIAEKQIF